MVLPNSAETEVDFSSSSQLFPFSFESIDILLENAEFQRRLKGHCARYNFKVFSGTYSKEDLYQDSSLRLWRYWHTLLVPGNVLSLDDFYSRWLLVLVRNQYCSRLRQLVRHQKTGLTRTDAPIEEFDPPADYIDPDAAYCFSLFSDFIKVYPPKHRRAVILWLEGNSLRGVKAILAREGVVVSHGGVRNWVNKIVDDFRESLEVVPLRQHK